jgi:hypothetical protein
VNLHHALKIEFKLVTESSFDFLKVDFIDLHSGCGMICVPMRKGFGNEYIFKEDDAVCVNDDCSRRDGRLGRSVEGL